MGKLKKMLIESEEEQYVFSLLKTKDTPLNIAERQECVMVLMATNEVIPKFIFRITEPDGKQTYEPITSFYHSDHILCMFTLPRQIFTLRCIKNRQGFGEPDILRLYVRRDTLALASKSNLSSNACIDNEQALMNWMRMKIGCIVVEPATAFASPQFHLHSFTGKSDLKFVIQGSRQVTHEQRSLAQRMMETVHASPRQLNLKRTIALGSSELELCLDSWELRRIAKPLKPEWIPKGGFMLYTRGSGRKRSFCALIEAICSGSMDAGTQADTADKFQVLGKLRCSKLCVLVCKEESFDQWSSEFSGPKIIMREDADFTQLTYSKALEGALVLITPKMLLKSSEFCKACLKLVNRISAKENNRGSKLFLDDPLCQRFHVSSLGERMPGTVCPLEFLTPRCAIIDDVHFNDGDANFSCFKALERINADWTWITVGFNGLPPTHLPMEWLKDASGIMGLSGPESSVYDRDGLGDQLLPNLYSQIHHFKEGMVTSLSIPRSLMRKVTLIPTKIVISAKESEFIANIKSIEQHLNPLSIQEACAEEVLLGCNVKNIQGFNLQALRRSEPMHKRDARESLLDHFFNDLEGTLAQRLTQGSLSATLSFSEEALEKLGSECCVCYSDPGAVLSLCGHGYCQECSSMLRKDEEKGGISVCSVCRASLCAYDWITVREGSENVFTFSKGEALLKTLDTLFIKRRQRRKVSRVYVVGPDAAKDTLKNFLSLRNHRTRRFGSVDTEDGDGKRVIVYTFEEMFTEEIFEDSLDAIILTCPCTLLDPSAFYSKLIRCALKRSFPIPIYLLYAEGIESCEVAKKYLNSTKAPSPTRA